MLSDFSIMKMLHENENKTNKKKVEGEIVKILNEMNYSLKVNNRYKENIIHVCATNNCVDILKCILQKHDKYHLEKKNAFGWTPLMQAVRNENMEMVKFLLGQKVIINDFSYLGMSVLSLSCAISLEMFELLLHNCPKALEYSVHDDINPLCVAVLKNDEELFFKLINLDLNVNEANDFTQVMIKQSINPRIADLAKSNLPSEDYWNDLSGIENLISRKDYNCYNYDGINIVEAENYQNFKSYYFGPKISVNRSDKIFRKNFFSNYLEPIRESKNYRSTLTPKLSCFDKKLPVSPNIFIEEEQNINAGHFENFKLGIDKSTSSIESNNNTATNNTVTDLFNSPLGLLRCQENRPPNLNLHNISTDSSNATLSFTPQFSPTKSPFLSHDINENSVFDEHTPTPPKYKSPPRGIILDSRTTRMIFLLQQYRLEKHIPTFVDQEIDLDLFLTLTDIDLMEIGIADESERLLLLSLIDEHSGRDNFF